jgi:drug/metabolite transporter (DMT)-like permease
VSRRAWVQLLTLAALWGAVYPLITIALRGLSPVAVVFGRVTLAALLLAPFAIHRDALRPLWKRPRAIIETVLVQSTVPLLLLTYGQQHLAPGLAGILVGAQPLFVALLAYRYAPDERPQGRTGVAGIVLGLLGLVLLFGIDLRGGGLALASGALVLAAAVCYAAGAIMIHRRHADAQPIGVATSAMLFSAAALALPTALTLPDRAPGAGVLAALAVLGVVCTGATLALFYTLIVRIGPARAALAFYLSPGFAVAFGAVFLSEKITLSAVAGLLAIVAGSLLAARRAEPAPP